MAVSFRRRIAIGWAVVGALIATPLAGVTALGASPISTPPGVDTRVLAAAPIGPVVLSGTLKDSAHHQTAGLVAALAWPDQQSLIQFENGQPFSEPTVGWSRAGKDGRFDLQVNPALVPAGYASSSGQINLEVVGWAGRSVGQWAVSTWLRTSAARALPSAPHPDIDVAMNATFFAPATASVTGALPTGGGGCIANWVDIGHTLATQQTGETLPYPPSPVSADFKITNTESMSLGIASSFTGGYGSWSESGTVSINNSYGHTYPASTADQDYNHWCETWLPQYEYWLLYNNGDGWPGPTSYPWWGNRATEGPQIFTRSGGSNFQLGGGVLLGSVIGLDLSVTESYSSDYVVNYYFTNWGYMCGNDNPPSFSSRIEQCAPPSPNGSTLYQNQTLSAGQYLLSDNSKYKLIMQGDGNLVLYSPSTYLWASWTQGHANDYALMQSDGNLVIYRQGGWPADWASGTSGNPGAYMIMQGDGNLVIYRQGGVAIWSSNTCCNRP